MVLQHRWIEETGGGVRRRIALCKVPARGQSRFDLFVTASFPYVGAEIKDFFEDLKKKGSIPTSSLPTTGTTCIKTIASWAELTWNTFRDHLDSRVRNPQVRRQPGITEPVRAAHKGRKRRKIDLLLSEFPSQSARKWFNEATFDALLRLRGVESNSPSGYSEGYYCRKLSCL